MKDNFPIISSLLKDGPAPGVCVGRSLRKGSGALHEVYSPIDHDELGAVQLAAESDVAEVIEASKRAFQSWRKVPAPMRGLVIKRFAEKLTEAKKDLAEIILLEVGKPPSEAEGEVQEMIDVCDFAVGLSRQLHGLTIASERPEHRLMEQWHPLGPVAIITAFNFPMAVWAWNAALALVCGDTLIWKPSSKTPLCALACHTIFQECMKEFPNYPAEICSVLIGDRSVGEVLANSPGIPLVSATGSTGMGRKVAASVAARLGRSLLELGGNNGMIICESADIEMAGKAALFSAIGTAGQRCTSLRRLFLHDKVANDVMAHLRNSYINMLIGDPRKHGVKLGPLIDEAAVTHFKENVEKAKEQGASVFMAGNMMPVTERGSYVQPVIAEIDASAEIVQQETFGPLLYVSKFSDLREVIEQHNNVPQGLSSAIFTNDVREAELFLSVEGSDCGIANVNIGTSGAEIGGAFGGEKDTGGGRESGSDTWKNYMRRATNTINYGGDLPFAQGGKFEVG